MSEMVERVAKAILNDNDLWNDMGAPGQNALVEEARRAIAAMREPTPEMLGAAAVILIKEFPEWHKAPVRAIFQAMIDEMLK